MALTSLARAGSGPLVDPLGRSFDLLRRLTLAVSFCIFFQAAASLKQRVGMTFDLRAAQDTVITGLWVGSDQVIRNGVPIMPGRPAFEGTVFALEPDGELPELRATWRYTAIGGAGGTGADEPAERQPSGRNAQAAVNLGSVLDAKMLELLRMDTDRRWLKLVLTFDADRLEVRGQIE